MAVSLDKDNNGVHSFAKSHISEYTKLHVHPSGRCVGYACFEQQGFEFQKTLGICNISIQNPIVVKDNEAIISTRHDIRVEPNASDRGFKEICRVIAFAPDGKQLAKIVMRQPGREEETSSCFASRHGVRIDVDYLNVVWSLVVKGLESSTVRSVELNDKFVFKSFRHGLHHYETRSMKLIECKWTPDSKHIAVCCEIHLYIFNGRLEQVFDISEALQYEREPNCMSSFISPVVESNFDQYTYPYSPREMLFEIDQRFATCKFDFDPTSCHELLAFGTVDRRVSFINSHTKQMDAQTIQLSSCWKDFIDCLQYHPSGKYVVAGTRNFTIYFVEPRNGTVLQSFDMHTECPNLRQAVDYVPSINRIAFSATGELLATATSDAKVRVYQMPIEMSLFDKCKWVILFVVPQTKLQGLPLPNPVINKLLAIPIRK
ncbi:uncharacterized protein LOC123547193 [Mercenaria mercenaria]|uniref:uncharacterized protein LOC123547193 n=1 Tax=Mercenaria mercenaria TaxID=6596 RepID=UPI00234EB27F|nr:uncharacterized protein LOC123547193 [Mercenaria mercenaria]